MRTRRLIRTSLFVSLSLLLSACAANADFQLVEDFESLVLGPIGGQDAWAAGSDSSTVAQDPAGGDNQVLSVITESTHLHREMLLQDGSIRMVFLRFRFDSQLSCSFGMSERSYPYRFAHFEPELSLTNSTSELRINDGGNYDVIAVLEPQTWYNCWLLIDNVTETSEVWLHDRPGHAANWADQLESEGQTSFHFRSATAGDLLTFYIKTGGGNGVVGPLFIDDIHMENSDALNLSNPIAGSTASEAVTPARAELRPAYPNPFNPHTSLSFALSAAMDILLTVHDAGGRQVATLAQGFHAAGDFTVIWDGKDDAGGAAVSGVYFAHLRAGDFTANRKLVLLR